MPMECWEGQEREKTNFLHRHLPGEANNPYGLAPCKPLCDQQKTNSTASFQVPASECFQGFFFNFILAFTFIIYICSLQLLHRFFCILCIFDVIMAFLSVRMRTSFNSYVFLGVFCKCLFHALPIYMILFYLYSKKKDNFHI